ncbi:hypothetical protein C8J57DRAFT_754517 [Mycena rebaudengoi]|nr:hypothetical protein C8J57DRAFT_754517 [Mycena rebaudengoi]
MYLPFAFILSLFYAVTLVFAAPTATSATPTSSSDSERSIVASLTTSQGITNAVMSSRSSTKKTATPATRKHHTVKTIFRPPNPTRVPPVPFPSSSNKRPSRHHHPQPVGTIVLATLGALAGLLLLASLLRCLYSYNRTPNHDRINSILHRHQLQREMEELERHPPERHRAFIAPPPPYLPPPCYPDNENTPLSQRQAPIPYAEVVRVGQTTSLLPNG